MKGLRHRQPAHPTPDTIDFQVVGELRDNPHRLLLLGDDGRCYCFDIELDRITPLDPSDSWSVDVAHQGELHMALPVELLAS